MSIQPFLWKPDLTVLGLSKHKSLYVFYPLVVMCCVLRYMWQQNGAEVAVLRKPELDAFLATALCPELRNAAFLTEMRLEMVTVRGVHLATMFMQVFNFFRIII